jgi:HD-like signal output (HDOD) protein
MLINLPRGVSSWVAYLDHVQLPVLRGTVEELARFKENEDNLNGRELSGAILHDPLMTLKVLRYLHSHHSRKQTNEITTIARAVMMVGTTPFFNHFTDQPLIDATLADHPEALDGMMRVMSRARHAALYVRDWSVLRHDVESDEVTIAALLRDLAEMLLWCYAPEPMLEISRLLRHDRTLRSAAAQQKVLGFELSELQLALAREWHLPALLQSLMDPAQADQPRTRSVTLAVALARHSANGWFDAALPDDYAAIQKLLNLPPEEIAHRIQRIALQAAHEWEWYGVPPAATWMPMLPGDWPA